jgi:predicted RNA-binding Zn-ribbon protein involved in translation (DUF1610 family)
MGRQAMSAQPAEEQEPFLCPNCGENDWAMLELMLPGGLRVACEQCGWNETTREIERRMREGEL